jgi:hypothetical protein
VFEVELFAVHSFQRKKAHGIAKKYPDRQLGSAPPARKILNSLKSFL